MRAPFRSMLPFSRGVSIATCGEAAIDRFAGMRQRLGGARRRARHRRERPACGAGVAGRARLRRRLLLRLLLLLEQRFVALLFHLRIADEILPADDDDERQHDGEDGVLVLDHSALLRRLFGRLCGRRLATVGTALSGCGAAVAAAVGTTDPLHVGGRGGRHQFPGSRRAAIRPSAASSSLHHLAKRRGERRPPADQHVIVTGTSIGRRRRPTRARSPASGGARGCVPPRCPPVSIR